MKTPLDLAIQWRSLRAERLLVEKEVNLLKEQEAELKRLVIDSLRNSKNKSVSDGTRLFQLVQAIEPLVEDWPKLQKHIQRTGEFEFLQRRLNPAAVKERWDYGKVVPGVNKIEVFNLSDIKAKQ
jgi:hypothetical protein